MTVRFRDEALQDLEDIAGFIARDNPAAAFAVVARIHSVIYETLDSLPHSGHARYGAHEFAVPHLPYVIVYKETNGDLDIIGVFHTSLHPETKHRRLDA
jgi:plasmid stabilization system protein ParE